jgi:hypothetical protein
MDKVYIVTAGEYSDYHMCAAFGTRELAEIYIQGIDEGGYDYGIEELELNPQEARLRKGYHMYRVTMYKNGDTKRIEVLDFARNHEKEETKIVSIGEYVKYSPPLWESKPGVSVTCWAKSDEHAVKITNEHRAQLIAENAFDLPVHVPGTKTQYRLDMEALLSAAKQGIREGMVDKKILDELKMEQEKAEGKKKN